LRRITDLFCIELQTILNSNTGENKIKTANGSGKSNQIKSNQIKFIKSRRTKVVTNTAITVTQHDTLK